MIGRTQLSKSCLICGGRTCFMACSDRKALNPSIVTFEMCSSIASFVSSVTPRTYSSIPSGNASHFPLRARPDFCCTHETRRLSLPHNGPRTALLRMVNASHSLLPELNWSLKTLLTFDVVSSWVLPRCTMAGTCGALIQRARAYAN
jgi:hypothetical protein